MKHGIYHYSLPAYLEEHGISQSSLKLLAQSPAHLRYYLDHPEPPTPDMIMGSVLDANVFEPARVLEICHVRPNEYEDADKKKKPWHNGANFCKEWNRTHSDKMIIPQTNFAAVQLMTKAILSHPAAAKILAAGRGGQCLFAEDAETGLQIKGRLDWSTGNLIADLKKCQDASPAGFQRTIVNFGYDIQAAWYLDLANLILAIERKGTILEYQTHLHKEHFMFICVEDTPPHCVAVYELKQNAISVGRSKYRRLLNRYMECVSTNNWPGYSPNIEFLDLPEWSVRQEQAAITLADRPAAPAVAIE